MIWRTAVSALALCVGAATSRAASTPAAEIWVFAGAAPGGDGGSTAQLDPLSAALSRAGPGGTVHLGPGRYAGTFVLPPGAILSGTPETVLVGEGSATVTAPEGAVLDGVTVEGGGWGLVSRGEVRLSKVRFREQTAGAVRVEAGRLRGERVELETVAARPFGLWVGAGNAELSMLTCRGGFARAVRVEPGASVRLIDFIAAGAAVALHASDAKVSLERAQLKGGPGPALFFSGGTQRLRDVRVEEHEYALLARGGARIDAQGFVTFRAHRAGLAVVESRLEARGVRVTDSGHLGGVQSVNGTLILSDFEVRNAKSYGIIATGGTGRLSQGKVVTVRKDAAGDAGEGLHVSRSRFEASGVRIEATDGPCLLALEGARLLLEDVDFDACGGPALELASGAGAEARNVRVRGAGGPAALVGERAELSLWSWATEETSEPALAADCANGAHVFAQGLTASGETGLDGACVQRWERRPKGRLRTLERRPTR